MSNKVQCVYAYKINRYIDTLHLINLVAIVLVWENRTSSW